ncbi:MAG: hypothetical protein IKE22_11385 [Atopobiaceae bacterium]|nr:hypothetical protein [Atopobiaceae bacterium]
MAQNITLMGASYSAVPAVVLPKTGGGTARFDDASVTTATASDVASGKLFLAADGTITTGTSSGGGSSKNVQVAQSTSRATSSTYTELISLTCATSGTYDVYWSGFRSSTGGTWGSQLYVNDTSRGSVQSTFMNHIQNVHLTGISLSAGDDVAVRARSRGSNYYAYIGTLTIVQTS